MQTTLYLDGKPFSIEEPWAAADASQRESLEAEPNKELGKQKQHPLTGTIFSALCITVSNDDMLFMIHGEIPRFAVVHLTWSGKEEQPSWPATTFFKDFDEFTKKQMFPDKAGLES